MRYSVEFKPSAARQLSKLSRSEQVRIGHRIEALSADPRPHGVEKIKGEDFLFRIRVGDYRVVYAVFDDRLLILIVKVGHRREVYRGF